MLHGWGSDMAVFKDLALELQKSHAVILLDLPGFGETEAPKVTWGLQEYAIFISSFLNKIKSRSDVIIAHSNGAAIAIKGLVSKLFDTNKFVIIGGAGVRNTKTGRNRFLKVIAKTGKPLLSVLPKSSASELRHKWYSAIGSEMLLVPGMEETFKKTVAEDIQAISRNVTTETLLIYGADDDVTPPDFGQIFSESMPNAQLEVIVGAGHFAFLDQPSEVTKLIKDFIG